MDKMVEGGGLRYTSMYIALRASLRLFKFVPDKFVEPALARLILTLIPTTHLIHMD